MLSMGSHVYVFSKRVLFGALSLFPWEECFLLGEFSEYAFYEVVLYKSINSFLVQVHSAKTSTFKLRSSPRGGPASNPNK